MEPRVITVGIDLALRSKHTAVMQAPGEKSQKPSPFPHSAAGSVSDG